MLAPLLDEPALADCHTLRIVFSGGEPLTSTLRDRFFSRCAARLVNLYGPTEVTIDAIAHECDRRSTDRSAGGVPIGRPVANTQAYVLDPRLQPSMVGALGELYLGGAGLARGYWRRQELTAAAFIPNPFGASPGARIYRTGDLARYRADGTIEYVGRTDSQIKLHGFRVELGEVETVLGSHPEVVRAVAAVQPGQAGGRLVAYVVPAAVNQLTIDGLRAWTTSRLPRHQVPAAFAMVTQLPLLPSGKIDRQALPPVTMATGSPAEPPRNATETALAAIWREVLGGVEIGRSDNFFAVGGDSILAIQIVSRARTAGLALTPRMLFEHPTIAELAAESTAMRQTEMVSREAVATAARGARQAGASLTPAQRWFFDLAPAEPHHFNQATLVTTPADFDPHAAARALAALAAHHVSLRTLFDRHPDGTITPRVDDHAGIPARTIDWRDRDPSVLIHELDVEHRRLDFARGPLLRLAWFNAGSNAPGRLAIVAHHLTIDAVSWRVLLDDLEVLYANPLHALPPPDASPAEWASAAAAALGDRRWAGEIAWWSRGPRDPFAVPRDFASGVNLVSTEEIVTAALDHGETAGLVSTVTSAYNIRVDEIVVAAFARALSSWTGARELWLDLEGHGREELPGAPVVTRTIGWFTSLYPARLRGPATDKPSGWLVDTKEQLRAIPQRGAGFGFLRYLSPDAGLRRRLGGLPPREIAINYLGRSGGDPTASRFRPAAERTGAPRSPLGSRPYLIELNASVSDHRLTLQLAYSSAVHRASTIRSLAAATVETLRSFIDHVRSADVPGFTASDFTEAGLNQDELTRLLARLAGR
jgi:non-ribosomal peptide synthase protein (TIGR01720 family)